jgi:hypothetical protein
VLCHFDEILSSLSIFKTDIVDIFFLACCVFPSFLHCYIGRKGHRKREGGRSLVTKQKIVKIARAKKIIFSKNAFLMLLAAAII